MKKPTAEPSAWLMEKIFFGFQSFTGHHWQLACQCPVRVEATLKALADEPPVAPY